MVIVPVATAQVGWVIETVADGGADGWRFITTGSETGEVLPDSFVTVKVYVPAARFVTVVLVPVPGVVMPPGYIVSVHVPGSGSPVRTTLPVPIPHVGWVIVPITGAV
jgi:hypothetical protein